MYLYIHIIRQNATQMSGFYGYIHTHTMAMWHRPEHHSARAPERQSTRVSILPEHYVVKIAFYAVMFSVLSVVCTVLIFALGILCVCR